MILTPENLPEGLGKEIINDSCTSCHELAQLTNDQRSAQDWVAIVEQMVGMGASISNEQYYPLLTYLTNNLTVSTSPDE